MSSGCPPGDRGTRTASALLEAGGAVNGGADALIGAAAADVAGHGRIDVGIAGLRILGEQRSGGHDLSRLAVTALRNVELDPGALHRVAVVARQTLDGNDVLAARGAHRGYAGTHRRTLQMHGAGTAQCHPTAVFGAREPGDV